MARSVRQSFANSTAARIRLLLYSLSLPSNFSNNGQAVGGTACEPRHNVARCQASNLAGRTFDHRVPHADLAVSRQGQLSVPPNGQDRRRSKFHTHSPQLIAPGCGLGDTRGWAAAAKAV